MVEIAKSNQVEEVSPITSSTSPIQAPSSLIEKADAVAQRIEAANKRSEELLNRQEAILARNMLSGRAEAGTINKTPEEQAAEKIDKEVFETLKRYKR